MLSRQLCLHRAITLNRPANSSYARPTLRPIILTTQKWHLSIYTTITKIYISPILSSPSSTPRYISKGYFISTLPALLIIITVSPPLQAVHKNVWPAREGEREIEREHFVLFYFLLMQINKQFFFRSLRKLNTTQVIVTVCVRLCLCVFVNVRGLPF